jgi:prophage tail gpP-like protein
MNVSISPRVTRLLRPQRAAGTLPSALHPAASTTSPPSSWQGVASAGSAGATSVDEGEEGDAVAGDAQIPVQTEVKGEALDPDVPRYRPHVVMAESTADGPTAMQRAVWQAKYNAARGTLARVIVPDWRQSDGSLWRLNQLVAVRIPFLSLDMELLIAGVSYQLNAHHGRHTELTVGPTATRPIPARCASVAATTATRTRVGLARTGMASARQAAKRATRSSCAMVWYWQAGPIDQPQTIRQRYSLP